MYIIISEYRVLLGGKQITFILSQVINDKNSIIEHSSVIIIGFLSFYAYRGIKLPKRFSPKRIIKVIFYSAVARACYIEHIQEI